MRCAILDDYQSVALGFADWPSLKLDITVFTEHMADPTVLAAALAPFEVIVAMRERTPITAGLLAQLPKLRLLVTTGMRNASIDLAAAEARGVVVCGTGSSQAATPELTWALILGLLRNLIAEASALRTGGPWQSTIGTELAGKRLGVVGLGKIGSHAAKVAKAFDMEVCAWSANLTAERAAALGVAHAGSLAALLETSDIVTIHLILSERTRGLIGAAEIARMKPSAVLINTSRGPIVDEAALVAALAGRRIAGAGIDVFDREPLPADHPFRRLPNVLATPHIGYVTTETYRVFFRDVVEDIAAWQKGAPIRAIRP